MTLREIMSLAESGVDDENIYQWLSFVQRAAKYVQRVRNWSWMRGVGTVTVTAGDVSADLPADFKELVNRRSVRVHDTIRGGWFTVDVVPASSISIPGASRVYPYCALPLISTRVYVVTGNVTSLYLMVPAGQDLQFEFDYFGYLQDATNPNDSNYLFTRLPDLVIQKAKALGYESVGNAEKAAIHETMFAVKLKEEFAADRYADTAGRDYRFR